MLERNGWNKGVFGHVNAGSKNHHLQSSYLERAGRNVNFQGVQMNRTSISPFKTKRSSFFSDLTSFKVLVVSAIIALGLTLGAQNTPVSASESGSVAQKTGRETGLALPRFVSLKSKSVNLRVGPGRKYAITWRYQRRGLPVEVIQEFDQWRRIRDADGVTGWVLHSLLSAKRTAVVAPTEKNQLIRTRVQ